MNAVLIGFTSSGKTITGRLLARRLGWQHLDLDTCLENLFREESGDALSVRKIFLRIGANAFAELEGRALNALVNHDRMVLSTGGRAPLNPANQSLLRALGKVVYLQTEPEIVFSRMTTKGLPVYLRDDPTVANLRRHWEQRDPVYRSVADLVVDNSRLSPDQTVDRIMTELEFE